MTKLAKAVLAVALLASLLLASVANAELVELNPKNFKSIVNNPAKNVFVMFYAPWCGHCNAMKAAWQSLADEYPIDGDVVIARVDGSMHRDIGKAYDVNGFPTLKFFSKSNKKGLEYSGPREVDAFKLFIKTNSN